MSRTSHRDTHLPARRAVSPTSVARARGASNFAQPKNTDDHEAGGRIEPPQQTSLGHVKNDPTTDVMSPRVHLNRFPITNFLETLCLERRFAICNHGHSI